MREKRINKLRVIIIAIITLIMMTNIGITAFAEETGMSAEVVDNGENTNENPTNPENNADNEENAGDVTQNEENAGDQAEDTVVENGANGEPDSNNPTKSENNSHPEAENTPENKPTEGESGEGTENLFEEIYSLIELNADKIFSVLAFVGTLVVSVGYKSGLLPLLRDALSKLKGAIDGVKEDGEANKLMTNGKLNEIGTAVEEIGEELDKMRWQYEGYEQLCREREAMRLILESQIDMLYAIFMTSALPQYQKDEVGEKISQMREELKFYEKREEN